MSQDLSGNDFALFFQAVHGYEPFAWQSELLHHLAAGGRWPELVDLPTGSGKTAVVDIALFHLALDAGRPPEERGARRRIVVVVDRRVIVDQVEQRGRLIADALEAARGETGSILARVGDALRSLSGDGPALITAALRGGIVRDETWARRPDVPAVLSSTVDQVGSRLLFRGYGVSNRMAPVHAGLLGVDTVLFLDEVHLSRPFASTLADLNRIRSEGEVSHGLSTHGALGKPLQVVELSATPGTVSTNPFPPQPLDPATTSPVLRKRLVASKPCDLVAVTVAKDRVKSDNAFTKAVVKEVKRVAQNDACGLLGVIVNRVDTARRVATALEPLKGLDVSLVTGRMRPLDRDALMNRKSEAWRDRSKRASERQVTEIVVATQSIEAGADFDFDAIVTESASVDALRQRFGRVDRRGEVHATGEPIRSVILNRGAQPVLDDPIYGSALGQTWGWLCGLQAVNFGITQLPEPPSDCVVRKPGAPLLTREHLRHLAQTSPPPEPPLDISRWLHGTEPSAPSVSVLWRSELDEPGLDEPELTHRLAFCPPMGIEAVELPLWAARQWLMGTPADPFSDVGSEPGPAVNGRRSFEEPPPVAVWRDRSAHLVNPSSLRPGETIVLPTTFGGIGHHLNWDPEAKDPVPDLADDASLSSRGRRIVRMGSWLPVPTDDEDADASPVEKDASVRLGEAFAALQAAAAEERTVTASVVEDALREAGQGIDAAHSLRVVTTTAAPQIGEAFPTLRFVGCSVRIPAPSRSSATLDSGVDTEDDQPSFTGASSPVLLADHLAGVAEYSGRFAELVGFEPDLAADLALAGEVHDLGKADPRFQRWLRGTSGFASGSEPGLLAKSAMSSVSWAEVEAARLASRYPKGMRHEFLSLALAESSPAMVDRAIDWDLVAHLVLTHHGYCRPLPPAVYDDDPITVQVEHGDHVLTTSSETGVAELGSGTVDRFFRMLDRFGAYELAYLEAVLRLADHHRSALEAEGRI